VGPRHVAMLRRRGRPRRPAWSATPPAARQFHIKPLADAGVRPVARELLVAERACDLLAAVVVDGHPEPAPLEMAHEPQRGGVAEGSSARVRANTSRSAGCGGCAGGSVPVSSSCATTVSAYRSLAASA